MSNLLALESALRDIEYHEFVREFANPLHLESFDSDYFNYNEIMKLEARFPGIITGHPVARNHNFLLASDQANHKITMEALGNLGKAAIISGAIILIFKILSIFLSDDFTKHSGGGGSGGGGSGGDTPREQKIEDAIQTLTGIGEKVQENTNIDSIDISNIHDLSEEQVKKIIGMQKEILNNFNATSPDISDSKGVGAAFKNFIANIKGIFSKDAKLGDIIKDDDLLRMSGIIGYDRDTIQKFQSLAKNAISLHGAWNIKDINTLLDDFLAEYIGSGMGRSLIDSVATLEKGLHDKIKGLNGFGPHAMYLNTMSEELAKTDVNLATNRKLLELYQAYETINPTFNELTQLIADKYGMSEGNELDEVKSLADRSLHRLTALDDFLKKYNSSKLDTDVANPTYIKEYAVYERDFLNFAKVVLTLRVKIEKSMELLIKAANNAEKGVENLEKLADYIRKQTGD